MHKLLIKYLFGRGARLFSENNGYVGRELENARLFPHPFARAPAHAIAYDRALIRGSRRYQRQTQMPERIGQRDEPEQGTFLLSPAPKQMLNVFSRTQTENVLFHTKGL